jgi:hypothetical protein
MTEFDSRPWCINKYHGPNTNFGLGWMCAKCIIANQPINKVGRGVSYAATKLANSDIDYLE